MVLLTMTPAIVAALGDLRSQEDYQSPGVASSIQIESTLPSNDPSLAEPALGQPISHGQIVDLWAKLRPLRNEAHSLEKLLQGSRVYRVPPPPKPEPSQEYKALMARLRRDEEARSYERMVNAYPHSQTFHDRFPNAATFASVNQPLSKADLGDDEITYNEVHRQVMLIINFMISILGVAATLWVAARWWTVPARLFLTLGGSILVGVAEVTVYSGYIWRLGEGRKKDEKKEEVKEIIQTWVVGEDKSAGDGDLEDEDALLIQAKSNHDDVGIRKRTAPVSDNLDS